MTLKTQMDNDLNIFFDKDEFADSATYLPKTGGPVVIDVIIDLLDDLDHAGIEGQKSAVIFWLKRTQIADPKFKDEIIHNAVSWVVERVALGGDGRIWQIECRKDSRARIN